MLASRTRKLTNASMPKVNLSDSHIFRTSSKGPFRGFKLGLTGFHCCWTFEKAFHCPSQPCFPRSCVYCYGLKRQTINSIKTNIFKTPPEGQSFSRVQSCWRSGCLSAREYAISQPGIFMARKRKYRHWPVLILPISVRFDHLWHDSAVVGARDATASRNTLSKQIGPKQPFQLSTVAKAIYRQQLDDHHRNPNIKTEIIWLGD